MAGKVVDEAFIEKNIPLVHSLCRRFYGRSVEYDDLFGAGCEGLIKAAKKFDESKGFSFSTYAVPVILGEIRRIFRDDGSVKVSRSIKELYLKIGRVNGELQKKLDREPTVNEIAAELNVTAEAVTEALCAARQPVSLTAFTDSDKPLDLPAADNTEQIYDKILVDSALKTLESREYQLITLRYFDGLTQSQTAKRLNMSQVAVSRLEKKALLKMRAVIN